MPQNFILTIRRVKSWCV